MNPGTNHLAGEPSLYLRQHSHNPVDWYPWGRAALERARTLDLPIFLSIGYSSCHWCHVMEHESFENPDIAAQLNRSFVSIKVDREERPDLDDIYMGAVVALTGNGGWPMSVFLTPALEPFFAGTYFPPQPRGGMRSLPDILDQINTLWKTDRERIVATAKQITGHLAKDSSEPVDSGKSDMLALCSPAAKTLLTHFDREYGGFGQGAKFPQVPQLQFLLYASQRLDTPLYTQAVFKTLDSMASGALHDHVGGGFHRYTVDRQWHTPHFEKMLCDNAVLIMLYCDAWRVCANPMYRNIACRTAKFLLSDLLLPEGVLAAALDADSESGEGAFYVWSLNKIEEAAGAQTAQFCATFHVSRSGNFESADQTRLNTLFADSYTTVEPFRDTLNTLLHMRKSRAAPQRDDKAVTVWNALAISALCNVYQITLDTAYLHKARSLWDALIACNITAAGVMRHSVGKTAGPHGFLDDYASLVNAAIDLYESSGEHGFLERAARFGDSLIELFAPSADGAFSYESRDFSPELPLRAHADRDSSLPSALALSIQALARLGQLFPDKEYLGSAQAQLQAISMHARIEPFGSLSLLLAAAWVSPDAPLVQLEGDVSDKRFQTLCNKVFATYRPGKTLAWPDSEWENVESGFSPQNSSFNATPRAHICTYGKCGPPLSDLEALQLELLNGIKA